MLVTATGDMTITEKIGKLTNSIQEAGVRVKLKKGAATSIFVRQSSKVHSQPEIGQVNGCTLYLLLYCVGDPANLI